jgi:DHA1 family bicyclomycin/chloramphenicol resistance-like MFS transporter
VTQRRRVPARLVVVLGALSAFGPLSMDLYLPALPRLADDLGTAESWAQLTMTACMVGMAVGQLLLGPISDRIGRRRPLLWGVTAYAVLSLLCAAAPTIEALLALRFAQGIAGGAGIVLSIAVVRDLYDSDTTARVFSRLVLVTGVAPIVAPVLGGELLRVTTWRGLFVTLSVIGCLILVATAWVIRETLPPSARNDSGLRAMGRQAREVFRDRLFAGYTAVLTLSMAALFTYISMSPFVLQGSYGLSAQEFSYVFASNAVGLVLLSQVGAWVVGRRGASWTLRAALLSTVTLGSVLLLVVLLDLGLPVVLFFLWATVGSGALITPTATALALDRHRSAAGTASGVLGVVQFGLGGAVAPLVSTLGTTPLVMVSAIAATSMLALAIHTGLSRSASPPSPREVELEATTSSRVAHDADPT